jgi:hypothetical protein
VLFVHEVVWWRRDETCWLIDLIFRQQIVQRFTYILHEVQTVGISGNSDSVGGLVTQVT